MKTIDKFFVVILVIIPLAVAVGVTYLLVQQDDVAPEDSSASTPTPTFETQPLTPVVNSPTPSPTPTFEVQPITPTNTQVPTATPTSKPTVTTKPTAIVSATPKKEPEDSTDSDSIDDFDELPKTNDEKEKPASYVNKGEDLTPAGILLVSIIVASTLGGLVSIGQLLRKKQDTST